MAGNNRIRQKHYYQWHLVTVEERGKVKAFMHAGWEKPKASSSPSNMPAPVFYSALDLSLHSTDPIYVSSLYLPDGFSQSLLGTSSSHFREPAFPLLVPRTVLYSA